MLGHSRNYAAVVAQRYTAALEFRDFRILWIASLSSGAAAWALIVARGWLVYNEGQGSLWVGVVTFAAMIPRVLVPPISGYLADRIDRRTIVAAMYVINLIQGLVLATLVAFDAIDIGTMVVLSVINGSARAAQMPASQALVPNLVPRKLLINGIALNQATMHGSRLLGPLAIAPLLAAGGAWAFYFCAGLYVISLVQTLRIRTASTGTVDRSRSVVSNLMDGLRYVYRTPILRAVTIMALFHCGLTMSFESLLPVLSDTRLDAKDAGFSLLMMAVGAGAMVAVTLIAGVTSEATRGKLFLNLGVVSGLAPAVLAMSPNMLTALPAAALMGGMQAGFMTLTHTMIQSVTDDGVRGRVGAVYSVHIGGMMATANLANGGFADIIAASILLIAGGIAFIIVMFASWQTATIRQIYRGELRYSVAAAD